MSGLAALSVTSKLTPSFARHRAREDRGRVERRPGARGGAAPSATSGAAAEVHAGSMLSAVALSVRLVALAGNEQVPESHLDEIS